MRNFEIYQTANGGWCAGFYEGTDRNRKVLPLCVGLPTAQEAEAKLKRLFSCVPIIIELPAPEPAKVCILGLEITDTMVQDWIEQNTTLHKQVEALYVVDGYQVTITNDDNPIAGPFKGQSLREAYAMAYIGTINNS